MLHREIYENNNQSEKAINLRRQMGEVCREASWEGLEKGKGEVILLYFN